MKELCDCTTGLSFVCKINNNNNNEFFITSDLLDVKSNRFNLLLQIALSVIKNPSLIILNNSIIGHPVDSLLEIIQRFQVTDDLFFGPQIASRQVIVVEHSLGCYSSLFMHNYKRIACNMVGTRAHVTHVDI